MPSIINKLADGVKEIVGSIRNQDRNPGKEGVGTSADFASAETYILARLDKEMPRLPYHNPEHVRDVLHSALVIAEHEKVSEDEKKIIRIAALFHDAGFIYTPTEHEAKGAEMVKKILPTYGFSAERIMLIGNMILATRLPQSPTSQLERILCDADLDYLGREDFGEIGGRLFNEMRDAGVVETEREWNVVQRSFLQAHKYHTTFSQQNREPRKQARLKAIVAGLNEK